MDDTHPDRRLIIRSPGDEAQVLYIQIDDRWMLILRESDGELSASLHRKRPPARN